MSDDDEGDENHIRYGTPLEAYEEDDVPGKKRQALAQAEQYAVDEQGRRRFHGAFTGGFTAGYGNTVTAPEGWAPAAFRSSRTEKAPQPSQKPEDFMDAEDRGQFGIAPREISTTKDFTSTKRKRQQNESFAGPIPGVPVLQALLQPAHDTVAMKILKLMGWKPGQGTGERLTAKEKQSQKEANHKVYGCHVPEELRAPSSSKIRNDSDVSSDEESYSGVLFAPDDFEPYVQRPKNDLFGLGYEGMSRRSILGSVSGRYGEESGTGPQSHLLIQDKGKKISIRGQAFGVGALEEEDEDIYAREDMSNYDFILGSEKKSNTKAKSNDAKGSRNILDGFVATAEPPTSKKVYPPPALPRDYKPGIAGNKKSRFEPIRSRDNDIQVEVRDRGLGRHDLSASERGELLGESPTIAPTIPNWKKDNPNREKPKTQTPEEIIAAITGRNINFVGNALDPSAADDDTGAFKPFSSNPEKQLRYENFLQRKEGKEVEESEAPKDKLKQWELERENKEFEQAARLYRPLKGTMGDRFVRPSDAEGSSIDPLASAVRPTLRHGVTKEQADAAAAKMFGKLTRTECQWRPESLLCKRFNIPDPFGQRPTEMSNSAKKKSSYSIFEFLEAPLHNKASFLRDQVQFSGNQTNETPRIEKKKTQQTVESKAEADKPPVNTKNKRMTVTEMFLQEKDKEKERENQVTTEEDDDATETIEKFDKIDLYKAIFLSDSESDKEDEKATEIAETAVPMNIERNTSPPRGIFANLDFDHLNSWRERTEPTENKMAPVTEQTNSPNKETTPEETYGPKLPDKPVFKPIFRPRIDSNKMDDGISVDSSSSSESWVETDKKNKPTSKPKKHKKGKKSHKEKHRKHKHKGKTKKHKK